MSRIAREDANSGLDKGLAGTILRLARNAARDRLAVADLDGAEKDISGLIVLDANINMQRRGALGSFLAGGPG